MSEGSATSPAAASVAEAEEMIMTAARGYVVEGIMRFCSVLGSDVADIGAEKFARFILGDGEARERLRGEVRAALTSVAPK